MFIEEGMGHAGGVYSIIECISVLFAKYIKDDPKDWFVLSKGHAGPAYYAALCVKGKISEEALMTSNKNGTLLPSHPDRNKTPGVDCTTGSLGQGISQAVGLAHGLKLQKKAGHVYCIIGDGECNEGLIWESLMAISHYNLTNLTLIVDSNGLQLDGYTHEVMNMFSLEKKFNSFGLDTYVLDGHDCEVLLKKLTQRASRSEVIIAKTIKGKGIATLENNKLSHHCVLTREQYEETLKTLI